MKSLLSAAVALALSVSAAAQAGSLVDVSVIDRDTGSVLPTHRHDGKLYIDGVPGHRYSVRLYNRTSSRVLTVLSVDGVNAISGQTANPNQSGYVLDAWQSTEIEGWRKNMSEIAQFNFTALDNSYAARTGRPNNVGVIGVAVFREKAPVWRERDDKISMQETESQPRSKDSTATPPPAAPATGGAAQAAKSANAPAGAARPPKTSTRACRRRTLHTKVASAARTTAHAPAPAPSGPFPRRAGLRSGTRGEPCPREAPAPTSERLAPGLK